MRDTISFIWAVLRNYHRRQPARTTNRQLPYSLVTANNRAQRSLTIWPWWHKQPLVLLDTADEWERHHEEMHVEQLWQRGRKGFLALYRTQAGRLLLESEATGWRLYKQVTVEAQRGQHYHEWQLICHWADRYIAAYKLTRYTAERCRAAVASEYCAFKGITRAAFAATYNLQMKQLIR